MKCKSTFLAALLVAAIAGAPAPVDAQAKPHVAPAAGAKRRPESALLRNLRAHIHHVFVIYQENRSFDSYFGTFPGADNLATAQAQKLGFREYDPIGKTWITPFLITSADSADPNHSRRVLIRKVNGGKMNQFVSAEENHLMLYGAATPYAHQLGLLTMAYEDCHTIPFLWMYAHRFALYDHIFDAMYGPSTPGNIDLIAAQTGQTQWAQHPNEVVKGEGAPGEPVLDDLDPAWGPYTDKFPHTHQYDQTYATVLLTLMGGKAGLAKVDSDAIRKDIGTLTRLDERRIPWGWYQEGFGNGKGDNHPAYIAHHNAPQYFGYIRLNQPLWRGVHDLTDFFTVIGQGKLPSHSVDFIKGGYQNPFGWRPANPSAYVQSSFLGDDDHPGYSDSQISESLVAKVVNTIARSPYWKDSVIIITWDDPGGFYDHVPPPRFETCPDKHPCGDGPRIPLILISPYARSGAIVHASGDQGSFVKFLDTLFHLPALASLPDEKPYLPEGPRDANPRLTNLLGGFSPARLAGKRAPIAASEAEIPDSVVDTFPPRMTCKETGVTPVKLHGVPSTPPKGFSPLAQAPGKK